MKKIFILLSVLAVAIAPRVFADEVTMNDDPPAMKDDMKVDMTDVQIMVKDIMKAQGVTEKAELDFSKITDKQFEDLGNLIFNKLASDMDERALLIRVLGGDNSMLLSTMKKMLAVHHLGGLKDTKKNMMMMQKKMMEKEMMQGGMGGMGMMGMHMMEGMHKEKSMVLTPDGGVLLMGEGKLVKFDKDLKLKKVVDIMKEVGGAMKMMKEEKKEEMKK